MQFHNLKRNKSNRKAKQVGRGGTRGKTSGRGTKGQNARAGRKKRPEMRDVIKRLPKLRGRGKNFLKSRFEKATPVKLSVLEEKFSSGEVINYKTLLDKGIIKARNGKTPKVKILADKKIEKSFVFEGVKMSENAKKLNG
jgi:large subunit ribosomal protein L15